jgi:hypothetical protein
MHFKEQAWFRSPVKSAVVRSQPCTRAIVYKARDETLKSKRSYILSAASAISQADPAGHSPALGDWQRANGPDLWKGSVAI